MKALFTMIKNVWKDETGQGMVEYGLILALIAVVIILVLTNLGSRIKDMFQEVLDGINTAHPTTP